LATKQNAAALPALEAEGERQLALADRLNCLKTAVATRRILTLGHAMAREYARAKAARAALDFDDLITHCLALLSGHGPEGAPAIGWVMYKLDRGIEHVLIDEAQDTSPRQWALIRALTGEFFAGEGAEDERTDPLRLRSVFAVGDEKQSIYSFQGAEP